MPKGMFDFDKCLKRLENYATLVNLESGAILESILLRNENNTPISNRPNLTYSSKLTPDRVSKQILDNLNISVGGRTPMFVSGDGNCLYHSISVGLYGNESLSSEIRVRT